MSIEKVSEKMKRKMSFNDYSFSADKKTKALDELDAKRQNRKPFERQGGKKFKSTVYLPDAENRMLNEIYSKHLLANNKSDKSTLISEAIRLLHQQEMKSAYPDTFEKERN